MAATSDVSLADRRMVGCRRHEGIAAAEQLARLYAPVRLFVKCVPAVLQAR
jgi:hypothetical protein